MEKNTSIFPHVERWIDELFIKNLLPITFKPTKGRANINQQISSMHCFMFFCMWNVRCIYVVVFWTLDFPKRTAALGDFSRLGAAWSMDVGKMPTWSGMDAVEMLCWMFFGEHPGILWIGGCLLDVFCDVLEWLSRMSLRSDLEEWSHIATASRLSWLLALLTMFLVWRSMSSCLASALYCNQDAFLTW